MTTDPIARARAITGADQARDVYRDWAATYDEDVFGRLGFTGSARIAELLAAYLPDRSAAVLDLGCGTGAVGRRLAELGFTTIDGIDLSPEMLAVAEQTGAYRTLSTADLTAPDAALGPDRDLRGPYAATVSAGTFTSGHVGPDAVPALLAAMVPRGVLAWVIGAEVWPAFEPALAACRVTVLHQALEPIRRDGSPEAIMFAARVPVATAYRPAAKVLLVAPDDSVLLFRGGDPSRPEAGTWWFPPGGGVEAGETVEDAARREVEEETGIVLHDLGPDVHRRRAEYLFEGVLVTTDEDYFVVRVEHREVRTDGWTELERAAVAEHRWWSLDELRSTGETVYPEEVVWLVETFAPDRPPT